MTDPSPGMAGEDRRRQIVDAIVADTPCEPRRTIEITLCRHIADMLDVLAAERGLERDAWIGNAIEGRFFR